MLDFTGSCINWMCLTRCHTPDPHTRPKSRLQLRVARRAGGSEKGAACCPVPFCLPGRALKHIYYHVEVLSLLLSYAHPPSPLHSPQLLS